MRITPISMAYSRPNLRPQNLRPQNQNVSFEGFFDKFKKKETKQLTDKEIEELLNKHRGVSDEELDRKWDDYAKKVRSGEIVPKPSEPAVDEDYKDNLEKGWDLYGTRN